MKGYLFDTNLVLIALTAPERISTQVRKTVENGRIYLSVLSYWEVLLKSMKAKLDVGNPRVWWLNSLDQLTATPLVLRPEHISEIYNLPPVHQDPFDRGLIAQAMIEDLTLVTMDEAIARYASEHLRVLAS